MSIQPAFRALALALVLALPGCMDTHDHVILACTPGLISKIDHGRRSKFDKAVTIWAQARYLSHHGLIG
jgi:hypothetical protein